MSQSLALGPLAPAVLERLEDRLSGINRMRDVTSTAIRLEHVAQALVSGRPEPEMFELAAALALWGLYQCRLRDQGPPTKIPPQL